MTVSYELYLVRHGVAEERGDAWPDDAKRPLTDEGISRMRKVTRGLAELGVSLDLILTSPLVRARQTAEILAAGLHPAPAGVAGGAPAPRGADPAALPPLRQH